MVFEFFKKAISMHFELQREFPNVKLNCRFARNLIQVLEKNESNYFNIKEVFFYHWCATWSVAFESEQDVLGWSVV
jgi:hypothetical protein